MRTRAERAETEADESGEGGCERPPHPIDGYGPAFRHAAEIDPEIAEGTDEGDGHGPATLVTWGEDSKGDSQDWNIAWAPSRKCSYPGEDAS